MTSGEAAVMEPAEGTNNENAAPHDILKLEGNKHFSSGDFVKAIAAYNKAIKADPGNGVLYSNRAAAFIQLGKEHKAIKDAEQAIELKPDWAKGYFRKGAALVGQRKWDEAVVILKKALELEPKSREINNLLKDATRKRISDGNGAEKKREDKGLKLVASNEDMPSSKTSGSSGSVSGKAKAAPSVAAKAPIGFSESVIETFVQDSLKSALIQYSQKGELKSIVYMQPSEQGESLQMVGIEAGFDSPQANEQCCEFLRTYAADKKALAVITMAEKKNIAYPQVWKNKTSQQWRWGPSENGILMQLDAFSVGATAMTTERKLWFIPTGAGGKGQPTEPVELPVDSFQIMPPLLRV